MDDPATRAADRVSFQLTYARSPVRRRFQPGVLTGPPIPCAYGGELAASGDWNDSGDAGQDGGWHAPGDDPGNHDQDDPTTAVVVGRSEADWVDQFAGYAVNEAVHEALEWFRLDGVPWLDPHGTPDEEDEVSAAVDELVAKLAAIRARRR